MGSDERDVDASGDQRFERGIGRRSTEAIETPTLQIRDTRGKQEPEQRTECEDVVGIAAAVGVVTVGRNITLMIEQPVEHMHGFACGCRNHLGVERRVAVGEVRVELDPGFIAVMGIDAARFAAEAAGPKDWPSEEEAEPPPNTAASGSRCC